MQDFNDPSDLSGVDYILYVSAIEDTVSCQALEAVIDGNTCQQEKTTDRYGNREGLEVWVWGWKRGKGMGKQTFNDINTSDTINSNNE